MKPKIVHLQGHRVIRAHTYTHTRSRPFALTHTILMKRKEKKENKKFNEKKTLYIFFEVRLHVGVCTKGKLGDRKRPRQRKSEMNKRHNCDLGQTQRVSFSFFI